MSRYARLPLANFTPCLREALIGHKLPFFLEIFRKLFYATYTGAVCPLRQIVHIDHCGKDVMDGQQVEHRGLQSGSRWKKQQHFVTFSFTCVQKSGVIY